MLSNYLAPSKSLHDINRQERQKWNDKRSDTRGNPLILTGIHFEFNSGRTMHRMPTTVLEELRKIPGNDVSDEFDS